MLNTRKGIEEVKAILEAMDVFNKVSVGKVEDLITETTFPSVYITMDTDINQPNKKMAKDGTEYDRIMLLTLQIHLDLTGVDELHYLDIRDMVEEAILKDTGIWNTVIDRDVIGSKWDTGQNYPKKQGEIALKLFTRACVN